MQTVYQLKARIRTDIREAAHICMMIELNQTARERREMRTIFDNEQGFNREDAPRLQAIANKLWEGIDPRDLSPAEQAQLKVYTEKYAAQYLEFGRYYYNMNNPVC